LTIPAGSAGTQRLIRCDFLGWGDWSPLLKALTSQRTPKKEKAAEPGREALAAFKFVGRARCLVTYIAVTFGSAQALR